MLATLRRIRTGRSAAPHALAVLADPVFSSEDARVGLDARTKIESLQSPGQGGNAGGGATAVKIVTDVGRSAADSGIQVFRRLLFSRQEAEAITGLLPASERLQALDFAADRRLALSGKLGDYRILHFATHGLLNNKIPAFSGLVFSLVDQRGRPLNGFLRLHEIYNLKLNADLVVLSGCQTALGQEVSGEGLIGLTRGFMYAGPLRVVASLWKCKRSSYIQPDEAVLPADDEGWIAPRRRAPGGANSHVEDGKKKGGRSAEINNYPQRESEHLSLVSETSGDYQFKEQPASRAARASYKIRVEDWRAATPRDSQFVDAERKFSEATRLLRRGKAEFAATG